EVVVVAEDGGDELGVVRPDALEDARAVVQAVREYVDLCVLPGDEVSVHPDEVAWLHVFPPRDGRGPCAWPRPCWRCRPGPPFSDPPGAPGPPRILGRMPRPAYLDRA